MDQKTRMFLIVFISQVTFTCTFVVNSLRAEEINTKPIYTKADLEVLQQGKNFDEFFRHAKDIVPTKRDRSWFEMVTTLATEMVDGYRKLNKYEYKEFEKVQKLAEWPELLGDEFFQVKRNAFTVEYLKRCYSKERKSDCRGQMQNFWKSARHDPETGHQLLVLSEGFFPKENSWSFIKAAANSELSNFYCQRPLVQKSLLKEIKSIGPELISNSSKAQRLNYLANATCWKNAANYLKEELYNNKAEDQQAVFMALNALSLLNQTESSTYLIKYFLEGPAKGELLNLAWTRLEEVSQNYKRRLTILENLKDIDPLPGKIFALASNKEKTIFTNHLSKNFPEYISLYSKTCMSYLTGEKSYPFGNPTMECHDLFKMDNLKSVGQKMISQPLRIKYSGLLKETSP
jgi:hypothetical protein